MSRDKHKDDQYFNCGQPYELDYVAGLYEKKEEVLEFLKSSCASKKISHFTHAEVYRLIKKELGFDQQ